MKSVEEVVACVIDYGSFASVAEKLAETMMQVYYYSPYEQEFQNIRDCVKGDGLALVERLDEFMDPEIFDTIDLFVFPDIGFGGLQRYLKSVGKAVWGSMGADELEIYRTYFLDVLKKVGLPVVQSQKLKGLTALSDYLKKNDGKWIKVDRFRANMETWHHRDYAHSIRMLDSLAVTFGGAKESVLFVVQDEIEADIEIGYDGWCIDGDFPPVSFQGYEKKNELYLGSLLKSADLPEEITIVNEAMSPILAEYGYRNWWATEVRVADGVPYFIDPTARMPGQTAEHQLETCSNLPDVIWSGANGIIIEPEFEWKFAAEATLHYDGSASDTMSKEWKTLEFPKAVLPWVKLYHYCVVDGVHHFPPHRTDEVGIVMGVGDSVAKSIDHLKKNLDALKAIPVHANVGGFADLIGSIEKAEEEGMLFGKLPEAAEVFEKMKDAL